MYSFVSSPVKTDTTYYMFEVLERNASGKISRDVVELELWNRNVCYGSNKMILVVYTIKKSIQLIIEFQLFFCLFLFLTIINLIFNPLKISIPNKQVRIQRIV